MLHYGCYEKQLEPSDLVSSRNGKWIGHAAARELKALRTSNTIHTEPHVVLQKHLAAELAPKRLELMRDASDHHPGTPDESCSYGDNDEGSASLWPDGGRPMASARSADVGSPDAGIGVPYITFVSFLQYKF
jgi:hypothetical protein